MKQLILASASPRRAELLRQIGLDFEVVVSNTAEEIPSGPVEPSQLVMELATAKAMQVAEKFQSGIVIGADTLVVLEELILGKPADPAEAITMLTGLSGRKHRVFTGIAVVEPHTGKCVTDFEVTDVMFRLLSQTEIQSYVATGEPLDKAGAYGIQGLGAVLVARIEGCYFNVVGLPLSKLAGMLQAFGVSIWQGQDGQRIYN